jgi:hypothetical protein
MAHEIANGLGNGCLVSMGDRPNQRNDRFRLDYLGRWRGTGAPRSSQHVLRCQYLVLCCGNQQRIVDEA